MIDHCNNEINEIQKKLKEVIDSFSSLNGINLEIREIKKSVSDGIIKNEIYKINEEITINFIIYNNYELFSSC
jgi:hypothetical protein